MTASERAVEENNAAGSSGTSGKYVMAEAATSFV